MTNALTIFNQLRPHTIGYDDIFDHFNNMFESSWLQNNYPPYDIIKHSDVKYDVQVALAGYSKEDIDIEVKENTLSIKSVKKDEDDKVEVLHRGIAKRYFERHFTIADDVKVNGAELKNGLLIVSLERLIVQPAHDRSALASVSSKACSNFRSGNPSISIILALKTFTLLAFSTVSSPFCIAVHIFWCFCLHNRFKI